MSREVSDWRGRIGVLSPNPNITLSHEWNAVLPEGISFHEAVMGLTAITPEKLLEMRQHALGEARKLADGMMDIMVFACTSGSFIGGPGYDEGIIKELEEAIGIPTTTTSTCVLTAFADLGIRKIALIGPYIDEVMAVEVDFLKEQGIETRYVKGIGYSEVKDYVQLHKQPYAYYRMARQAYRSAPDIDAVFITCMASPAIKVINTLELDMGIPVISSLSATLYGVLKRLEIRESIEEFGRLGRLLGDTV